MFTITKSAAAQIKIAAEQGGSPDMSLRLAAHTRADGSIDYQMGFDEASEDDIRFKSEQVDVVIAPEYVPLLDQAVLDFVTLEGGDAQFIFLNPKDPHYKAPSDN